jgi:hypothetical protein
MFICIKSILLIAVRGFIFIFLCMGHDLSQMGATELLGASEMLPTPFVCKSSVDGSVDVDM